MKSDVDMLRAIETGEAIAEKWRRLFDRWMLRFKHHALQVRAARERERQIALFSKYECVGGPFDGELVRWRQPELSMYVVGGTYNHGPDHRLHFEQLAPISFGGDDPEC